MSAIILPSGGRRDSISAATEWVVGSLIQSRGPVTSAADRIFSRAASCHRENAFSHTLCPVASRRAAGRGQQPAYVTRDCLIEHQEHVAFDVSTL